MDVHIGRQAIVDTAQKVVAYELLFRANATVESSGRNDVLATATVLRGSIFDIGLHRLLEGHYGLVNVPGDLLLHPSLRMLPADRIALEILETVQPTPEILAACRELKDLGFHLVLDDYTGQPELEPLLEFVSCVKIDFRAIEGEALKRVTSSLQSRGKLLLAEKIETEAEFRLAARLGYKFFQGYFVQRPRTIRGRHVPPRHINLIRILSMLSSTEGLSIQEVEKVIAQDVGLTVKLLRFANTAANSAVQMGSVDSLAQCFMKLGELEIRRFVAIATLPQLGSSAGANLVERAVIRARMCEILAMRAGHPELQSQAFLVGMFSLLDAIMSVPMPQILKEMHLAPGMYDALIEPRARRTPLGLFGELARCYEEEEMDQIRELRQALRLSPEQVAEAYVDAVHWASTNWGAELDTRTHGAASQTWLSKTG